MSCLVTQLPHPPLLSNIWSNIWDVLGDVAGERLDLGMGDAAAAPLGQQESREKETPCQLT